MWNRTSGNTVVVHRSRRIEAEQAISDLQQRGYEVIYPLTKKSEFGKVYTTDGYRPMFVENAHRSQWVAKLRRVAE